MRSIVVWLAFVALMSVCITTASSDCCSNTISKEVMQNLEVLYSKNPHIWQLQKCPLPKMITLLSGNEGYRLSLENTVHISWEKFWKQVYDIIDEETAKSSWTFSDFVNAAVNAKAIYELVGFVTQGTTFEKYVKPDYYVSTFFSSKSKEDNR